MFKERIFIKYHKSNYLPSLSS
ncbi:hypothetical protein NC651_011819 [Populus alba x Populus x berolinensis]|nr:hypothetical protein NC651_011819 [Populus alba x Populus x berolinensis]